MKMKLLVLRRTRELSLKSIERKSIKSNLIDPSPRNVNGIFFAFLEYEHSGVLLRYVAAIAQQE